ncbi:MAG: transcriptional regulator FtsR [Propionibacteriaceae bacterium]
MASTTRSIGQVLAIVKMEFPDVSISKIRFLETEGLLSPERAASGYRRYSQEDLDRLKLILSMQKNQYLPLKVIKEHLDMLDRGVTPPSLEQHQPSAVVLARQQASAVAAELPESAAVPQAPATAAAAQQATVKRTIRMTRKELLDASGLPEPTLVELERQLLIAPRRGTGFYGRDALTIAIVARRIAAYGMDARHLAQIKQAAERAAGIIEQSIAPYTRRNAQASEITAEVTQLIIHAHAALMRTAMDR